MGLTCSEALRHDMFTQLQIPVTSRALRVPLSDSIFHARARQLRVVLVLDHFELMHDVFPAWDVKSMVRYELAADAHRSGMYIVAINTSDRQQAQNHIDSRFHVANNIMLDLNLNFAPRRLVWTFCCL